MSSDTLDYSNQTSYARTPAAKVAHNRRERERRRKTAASFEHIRELLEKLGYACRGRDKPAVLAAMEFALEQEYEAKRREEPAWSQANVSDAGSGSADPRKRPRIEVECDSPAKTMLDSAFFSSTIPAVIVDTSGIVMHTNVASTHLFHGLEIGATCKKLLKATSHVDFDQNLHQAITKSTLTNGKPGGEHTLIQFFASLENAGTNPEDSHIRIIFNPFNHAGTTLIHVLFVKDTHQNSNQTTTNNIANGTNNEAQMIAHPSHFAHMINAPHFSYPYGISPGRGINGEFTAASMASGGSIDRVNKQEPWQQGGEHLRALLNPIPPHENYISGWPTGSVPPQVVPHYSNGSTTLHQHPQWQHTGPFTQSPAGIRPVVLDHGHAFAAQASGKPSTQLLHNMPQYWSNPGMGNVHNNIHALQMTQPQLEPSKANQILPISSSPNARDISSKTTGISPSPTAPTPTEPTENSSRLVS